MRRYILIIFLIGFFFIPGCVQYEKVLLTTLSPIPTTSVVVPTVNTQPVSIATENQPPPLSIAPELIPSGIYTSTTTAQKTGTFFNRSTMQTVLPEDILQEVLYAPSGGGGGPIIKCARLQPDNASLQGFSVYELVTLLGSCIEGGDVGETVNIVIDRPDGNQETYSVVIEARPDYEPGVSFFYQSRPDDPPGWYRFNFQAPSGSAQSLLYQELPNGPRIYRSDSKLQLRWFQPNEQIRLFGYRPMCTDPEPIFCLYANFLGWQIFQVDSEGSLMIEADASISAFAVLSVYSGEKHPIHVSQATIVAENYYDESDRFDDYFPSIQGDPCFKEHQVSFQPGDFVRIILRVGDDPSKPYAPPLSDNVVEIATEEEILMIIEGPTCVGESTRTSLWWKVQTSMGVSRWVEQWEIQPYPVQAVQCEMIPISRLETGALARVLLTEGEPLNLRKKPMLSSWVIDSLNPDTIVVITGGPVCADGYLWWQAQTPDGRSGWLAEGDLQYYYLAPEPPSSFVPW